MQTDEPATTAAEAEAFRAAVREAEEVLALYFEATYPRHILQAYRALWSAKGMLRYVVPSPAFAARFEKAWRQTLAGLAHYVDTHLDVDIEPDAEKPQKPGRNADVAMLRDARILASMKAEYQRIRLEQAAWLAGHRSNDPPSCVVNEIHKRVASALSTSAATVRRRWTEEFLGPDGPKERHRYLDLVEEVTANDARIQEERSKAAAKAPAGEHRPRLQPLTFSRSRRREMK